ncbi:PAS domain S-box protein [uncultured Methanoregula sp.]|uniref:PAS domain S-box protein n=1 Tax=uncultured Methanoregula sp. TaxID=1005933 RepID=UPI002AAC1EAF|nr:PAS domain S-box protein [uncultured Methanoregula sp.]
MTSVLYLDDEPVLLELTKTYLERNPDLTIDTAQSFEIAHKKMVSGSYDAIISDYDMPEMNGIDFLKYVRGRHADLPFILFTGKGREDVVIDALNNGADFYIQKGGEPRSQFAELAHKVRLAVSKKDMEKTLLESKQRMADIIDHLPDATLAVDRSGRVIVWNNAIEEMTGIPREVILGKGEYEYSLPFYGKREPLLLNLIMDEDPDVKKRYSSFYRNGNRLVAEIFIPGFNRGAGAHIRATASPLYDRKNNITGAIESIRDITSHKKTEEMLVRNIEELHSAYEQLTAAEEELRQNYDELNKSQQQLQQSEERYRDVVEDQTEFICRFAPDGTISFVNGAYCRYFGLGRESIIGAPHDVIIPPEDLHLMKRHLSALSPENPVGVIEHRIQMPAGGTRWHQWTDRAIFDTDGRITEYQSIGRDITERRMAEAASRQANKKLLILNSITRHDIVNQLLVLRAYIEISKRAIRDPTLLGYIEKEEQSALIIKEQIEFTRNYQNLGMQVPRWQVLADSIGSAIGQLNLLGIDISIAVDPVEIFADPLMKKVFYNLMENSLRHGVHVTRIDYSVRETANGLIITCRDNGVGIPAEDKQQLFQKGFGKHTGLGLFLSKEILSITGIAITENGEPGKGVQFEMTVPKGVYRFSHDLPDPDTWQNE